MLKIFAPEEETSVTRELHANKAIVVGRSQTRSEDQYVGINDPSISRNHAQFFYNGESISVVDLNSTNGTVVHGKAIPPKSVVELFPGDQVEIGRFKVHISMWRGNTEVFPLEKTQPITLFPTADYEMLGIIGDGADGSVWKARNRVTGRIVAIKLMKAHHHDDEERKRRFKREAEYASRIDSPFIVKVHDTRVIQGRLFLIMEYVEGGSLQKLRTEKEIRLLDILIIARDIACALQVLLSEGVIHRDVKPGNIIITNSMRGKLTDFGIARPLGVSDETIDNPEEEGNGMGSLGFVAPEQAKEREDADERSDIYSLGATIYFMFTGDNPLGMRHLRHLRYLFERYPRLLHEVDPRCPKALSKYVMKMLSRDPAKRPQGPGEVVTFLSDLIDELRNSPQPTPA